MLGAIEENVNAFVEALKRYVCDSHGLKVWRECVRNELSTEARDFINNRLETGTIVDTDDLEYFAEDFYSSHHPRIKRIEKRIKEKAETRAEGEQAKFSSPAHGSLQNIAAYATLLPPAIRARERILGQREPLTYDEAKAWLEQEAECGEHLGATTITFELRLPTEEIESVIVESEELKQAKAKAEDYWLQRGIKPTVPRRVTGYDHPLHYLDIKTPRDAGRWLEHTLANHQFLEYERDGQKSSYRERWFQPRIRNRGRYAHLKDGNSITLDTDKLTDLAESAEALLPVAREFDRAVWLILTGHWIRLGVQGVHEMPDVPYYRRGFGDRGTYCLPPITLEVCERETTPGELASYYAEMKQINSASSKTRVLSYESEVIALAALELIELQGVYAGDKGFSKKVLAHFEQRAVEYGIDPYTDFSPGGTENQRADAVRQALARIERAHQALHEARRGEHEDGGYTPAPLFYRWGKSTTA